MDYITAIILALVQGFTEFLPVSSQAHLVLAGEWFGEVYQGLDFDVILHAGSLVAVVYYFRKEIFTMLRDWAGSLAGKGTTKDSKLGWWVIIGTLPAGILGIVFKDLAENEFRSLWIMGGSLIVFGLLLGLADFKGRGNRDEYSLSLKDVLIIGFAQALALVPGTSRSGITMTAALFLGMSREAAARFSFLLSVPIIAAASLLYTIEVLRNGTTAGWGELAVGFVVSALSTYACIHYFLAFIKRVGMQPFVLYRVILGLLILSVVW
ncbi:undecaprenyl-diphosphate phosphatase [Aliidiomarina quisquiliarum]|uniref:undecaprenyl-diphosphate phosphatase n=1 Tax=Aliidiomarina quisquiliarum TaxID=2938947 RepID=UPI00208E8A7E|nr:undecaprenyl-diphosphate phosphatase [Aliidiomarina quisquiliarum]MCO4321198.1 undecaprenyl-diphosphate phosphatase [Aliidiomarina quisquiliarum]